jgi:amino acid permease
MVYFQLVNNIDSFRPASLLIAYPIVGGIMYLTMLAGSFCTFAGYVSLISEYWVNKT